MNTNENAEALKPGDEGYVDPADNQGNEGESENQNGNEDDSKENDGSDKKDTETPEAKRARLKRQLEQLDKKHPELAEDKPAKKGKKSTDLDYGEKAFLVANGIKGTEETDLVKSIMSETGKSLDDVLESKYFQGELKEMRQAKATADATPGNSKRSGQSAQNTVEYWIAKGELPPSSDPKLRTAVVNAKIAAGKNKSMFTNNPVVQ